MLEMPQSTKAVEVRTTDNRGFSAAELAEQCAQKIISVADTAHPAIRDQARAFQKHIELLVEHYLKQGVRSDRTNVYNALNDAGHPELAELIRRL